MPAKFLKNSRKLGSVAAAVQHKSPAISALFPHMFNGTKGEFIPGAGTPVSVQGFQPSFGKDHVFETMRARDMERHLEVETDVVSSSSQKSGEVVSESEYRESECYQPASNVSLHCVMQANVPEPYSNKGRPSHLNMPGGSSKLDQKYTSSKLNSSHQSRKFTTFVPLGSFRDNTNTINLKGMQGIFPRRHIATTSLVLAVKVQVVEPEIMIPSTIRPEEESLYKLWMGKNKQFYFDYAEQYDSLVKGEKSLTEVVREQDALMADIARQYETLNSVESYNYEGIQGDIQPQAWLKNHTVASLNDTSNPCPQGVQGLNCEHFKVWLENCTKYNFVHCDEQLKDVKEGRKTLGQIFEEQEQIIRQVAEDYKLGGGSSGQWH